MSSNYLKNSIPINVGTIYFVGIGGIGMSGIAEVLKSLGYVIKGSDVSCSSNVERLVNLGIPVNIGQKSENIKDVAVVVRSSAIKSSNPEIVEARKQRIPVIKRAEMLAELMRFKTSIAIAGTHGKTTTTSLMASLFEADQQNPTVINGGIINAYGTNAKMGESPWMIAEADESDGTFLKLPATIAVVTNIDAEHMEHYGTFENLYESFRTFVENIPFYGFAVMCKDHDVVSKLIDEVIDRKIISYGFSENSDVRASNVRPLSDKLGSRFDVEISDRLTCGKKTIKNVSLAIPGMHNVLNSLSVIATGIQLGFNEESILKGLGDFQGVKRRFTLAGKVNDISIIDDYAHHPKEIKVTLKTAKSVANKKNGKVIAIVQPHRYSRLKNLFEDFVNCLADADHIIITDVYEAGEKFIEGFDSDTYAKRVIETGKKNVIRLSEEDHLPNIINNISNPNDLIVFMGAGSITHWANRLPAKLQEIVQDAI